MEYALQLIKLLFVLGLFAFGAYILMKKIKTKQRHKVSDNRLIQVIDGIQIGLKDEVLLMKLGKEYIVMNTISGQMLALKSEEMVPQEEDFNAFLAKENPSLSLRGLASELKKRAKK